MPLNNEEYLKHYGVIGMHWGARKLKPTSISYSVNLPKSRRALKKKMSTMTDYELQKNINRLNKEKQLMDLKIGPKNNHAVLKKALFVGANYAGPAAAAYLTKTGRPVTGKLVKKASNFSRAAYQVTNIHSGLNGDELLHTSLSEIRKNKERDIMDAEEVYNRMERVLLSHIAKNDSVIQHHGVKGMIWKKGKKVQAPATTNNPIVNAQNAAMQREIAAQRNPKPVVKKKLTKQQRAAQAKAKKAQRAALAKIRKQKAAQAKLARALKVKANKAKRAKIKAQKAQIRLAKKKAAAAKKANNAKIRAQNEANRKAKQLADSKARSARYESNLQARTKSAATSLANRTKGPQRGSLVVENPNGTATRGSAAAKKQLSNIRKAMKKKN